MLSNFECVKNCSVTFSSGSGRRDQHILRVVEDNTEALRMFRIAVSLTAVVVVVDGTNNV